MGAGLLILATDTLPIVGLLVELVGIIWWLLEGSDFDQEATNG